MPGLVSCTSSDAAVVKSGWEKKARANAPLQGRVVGSIPGSCRESSFCTGDPCGHWDEMDIQEENIHERIVSRKQNPRGLQKMCTVLGGRGLLVFG